MADKLRHDSGEKGLSAGVLAVVFLLLVGVCAVFFSLGFLVGYSEQSSKAEPLTERVTTSGVIPPTVNSTAPEAAGKSAWGKKSSSNAAPGPTSAVSRASPPVKTLSPPLKLSAGASVPARTTPSQHPWAPSAAAATNGEVRVGFTVQVDALRGRQDADAVVKILKTRGYPVFLVTPEYANAGDNLYRVQVGPFSTREDAERVRAKLSDEGFKPFIKH